MSFCLNCGKVLSTAVQAQRDVQGVKKRQCKSCGRADELNHRYCIFCGADIKAFVAKAANPAALVRFTTELSHVTEAVAPGEALRQGSFERDRASTTHAPTVYKTRPQHKPSYGAVAVQLFLLLGLASGAGLAYGFKGILFQAYNLFKVNLPKDGLLLFTEQPSVNIVAESVERKVYTLGQTKNGSLAISGLDPGIHRITFSNSPNSSDLSNGSDISENAIIETVNLLPKKLNMLGYEQKVDVNSAKH